MLSRPTLFIIGAGAGKDIEMPLATTSPLQLLIESIFASTPTRKELVGPISVRMRSVAMPDKCEKNQTTTLLLDVRLPKGFPTPGQSMAICTDISTIASRRYAERLE